MKKLYSLDLLRVIAAFGILFYHISSHCSGYFGIMDTFIATGGVFMVLFFALSGFVLYYCYDNKDLIDIRNIKAFWKKRFVTLYPCYIFITTIYLIIHFQGWRNTIIMAPVEILLLHQYLPGGARNFACNSLTWFLSCLVLAYFLFPFMKHILKNMKMGEKKLLLVGLWFVSSIAPFSVHFMEYEWVYNNPYFKLMEFVSGMVIADLYITNKEKQESGSQGKTVLLFVLLIACVSLLRRFGIGTAASYIFFDLPIFLLLILEMARLKDSCLIVRFSTRGGGTISWQDLLWNLSCTSFSDKY